MRKLFKNAILCWICNDVLVSKDKDTILWCSGHHIGISGGLEHAKRYGNPNSMKDLSEWIDLEEVINNQ